MSQLDKYISKLLSDDGALREFLVDPIKAAEDDNGLNKGQRSVLRRVIANLSNNSTNGYGIVRSLDSYRRSIRLLQNVLHQERGHALASQANDLPAADNTNVHNIYIYYNGIPDDPTINNPYTYYMLFQGSGDTVGDVMNNAKDGYGNKLTNLTASENGYITAFKVPGDYLFSGTYAVPLPTSLDTQDPFWFYSVNGQALSASSDYTYINNNAYFGSAGYSYVDFSLEGNIPENAPIYWQVIAPDVAYGFNPCDTDTVDKVFG